MRDGDGDGQAAAADLCCGYRRYSTNLQDGVSVLLSTETPRDMELRAR
jgi:hypothetical protein